MHKIADDTQMIPKLLKRLGDALVKSGRSQRDVDEYVKLLLNGENEKALDLKKKLDNYGK